MKKVKKRLIESIMYNKVHTYLPSLNSKEGINISIDSPALRDDCAYDVVIIEKKIIYLDDLLKLNTKDKEKLNSGEKLGTCGDFTVFNNVDPEQMVKASPDDIIIGNEVYILGDDERYHKMLIEEVLKPNDNYKAFTASDGCRYGLHCTFVKKKEEGVSFEPYDEDGNPTEDCFLFRKPDLTSEAFTFTVSLCLKCNMPLSGCVCDKELDINKGHITKLTATKDINFDGVTDYIEPSKINSFYFDTKYRDLSNILLRANLFEKCKRTHISSMGLKTKLL